MIPAFAMPYLTSQRPTIRMAYIMRQFQMAYTTLSLAYGIHAPHLSFGIDSISSSMTYTHPSLPHGIHIPSLPHGNHNPLPGYGILNPFLSNRYTTLPPLRLIERLGYYGIHSPSHSYGIANFTGYY